MPQLDFSFYLSQIIGLIVSFGIFFCISKFLILKQLDKILLKRKKIIDNNINYADEIFKKAEEKNREYEAKMVIKQNEINKQMIAFNEKQKNKQDKKISETKKMVAGMISDNLLEIKNELKLMENNINDQVLDIIASILRDVYKIDNVDKNEIKKIFKEIKL